MSEVPSLWYDLGLNYLRQSSLPCPAEGDQNSPSLLLEKAQQVIDRILHYNVFASFFLSWSFKSCFLPFSVFEKSYHDGQREP